jgi:ribosome-binding factor A
VARDSKFSKEKYQERITKEINTFLRKDFADPRLQFVTVTHTELNRDFSVAKVYWDTFNAGTRGEAKKAITSISGKMRTKLTQVMKVRHIPTLTFIYNSQFEDAIKIENLVNKSSEKDPSESE